MRLSLRSGEKLYINGAVVSVDRKVSIELLNDVTFLLESHIMQAAEATTPLRQLYFVVQLMLMDPGSTAATRTVFDEMIAAEERAFTDAIVLASLRSVRNAVDASRPFDALRTLREQFAREDTIIRGGSQPRAA